MTGLIGLGLALSVAAFARAVGFDRERLFYPLVLIVIASYYVLFAAMAADHAELAAQSVIFGLFTAMAVVGFRTSLWLVVLGLVLHALFDVFQKSIFAGHGVPQWWPSFCLAYDLAAAASLAVLLIIEKRRTRLR